MNSIFYNGDIENTYIDAILKEMFRERIYDRFLMGKDDLVTVDIGANIGLVTHFLSRFSKKVYSVEPSEQHYKCLEKLIEMNQLSNVFPIKNALSDKCETMTFYHNQNSTMFSLIPNVTDGSEPENVEAVDIETLWKKNKIGDVDFVKLDVEGSEFDVVGSEAFEKISPHIKSIMIEHHAWSGRNPAQLQEMLANLGFHSFIIPAEAKLIGGIK